MAQYAVLIYFDDVSEKPEDIQPHDRYADELIRAGSMIAAFALTPRDMATSVRAAGITDGPFLDAKEVIAGFYLLEADDLDAALTMARRNPVVAAGGGVEVRPVAGAFMSPATT